MYLSNQDRTHTGRDRGLAVAVETLVAAWTASWNAHDMRAAAALVEDDVDFVTVAGRWLRGRDEFLRHHLEIHAQHMRTSTWMTSGHAVRRLGDGLALAHLDWIITGELDARGELRPERPGIFTWLLACPPGHCVIVAAHNTNLRADTSPRLSGRARP